MTTKSKVQDKNKLSDVDENILKLFDIKKRLGKGAYGIVWKAMDKRTNETLAVKKIFDAFRDETDAQRTFREICFLQSFRSHPNVVRMLSVYKAANNLDIYLVFEYMESDLHNIIKKGTILKDIHKRYIMCQLVNAVRYIHSGNVIHRDLKPSNVLIDSKCRCKLADFGLARSLSSQAAREANDSNTTVNVPPLLTDYVATRWYRAPEILVASKRYTKGIDMWSLGCILAEMIRGKPLFQGTSTINQIEKIVSALPDITDHDISAVGAGFGSVLLSKQTSTEKKTCLEELIPDASSDALDMIKSLLVLDPLGRLTADQAINHNYVDRFRHSVSEMELNKDVLIPFRDDIRLTVSEYRTKLYEIAQAAEKYQSNPHISNHQSNTKRYISSSKRNAAPAQASKPRETKYLERTVLENPEICKKISKISISSSLMNSVSSNNCMESLGKHFSNTTQPRKVSKQAIVSPTVNNKYTEINKAPNRNRTVVDQQRHLSSTHYQFPQQQQQQQLQQHQQRPFEKKHHGSLSRSKTPHRGEHQYELDKRHSIDGGYGSLPADTANSQKTPTAQSNNNAKVYKSSSISKLTSSESSNHILHQMADRLRSPTQDKYRSLQRSSSVIISKAQRVAADPNRKIHTRKGTAEPTSFCYDARIKKIEAEIAGFKDDIKKFAKENKYYSKPPTPTKSTPTLSTSQQYQQQLQQQQQLQLQMQASQTRYPQVRSKYTIQHVVPTENAPIISVATTTKKSSTSASLAFPSIPREKNDISTLTSGTGGSGDHIGRTYNSSLEISKSNDLYKYSSKQRHHISQHQQNRTRVSSKVI